MLIDLNNGRMTAWYKQFVGRSSIDYTQETGKVQLYFRTYPNYEILTINLLARDLQFSSLVEIEDEYEPCKTEGAFCIIEGNVVEVRSESNEVLYKIEV